MKSLILSPHTDDVELFIAFTAIREKPHVIICTESYIQANNGYGITQEQRWKEAVEASDILGYPILNLGLRDDTVTEEEMEEALSKYAPHFDMVYAPMFQGGNIHHDMINRVAKKLWRDRVVEYSTYTKTCLHTVGNKEVIPTEEELALKNKALMCHKSQFEVNRIHFEAVFGRSEWLNDKALPLYQVNGMKFSNRKGTWDWHIIDRVYTSNGYKLPSDMKGETFIDIGAHVGAASLKAAEAGAKVIAYEPAKDNFRILEENIKNNSLDIKAINKAVGPKGKATLIYDTCNTGQSTCYESRNDFGGVDLEEVEMVPLAEVLEGVDDCYLKMDCEGGEVEIVKEIVGGLYKKIHTIVMEFHFQDTMRGQIEELSKFYNRQQLNQSNFEYKFIRK